MASRWHHLQAKDRKSVVVPHPLLAKVVDLDSLCLQYPVVSSPVTRDSKHQRTLGRLVLLRGIRTTTPGPPTNMMQRVAPRLSRAVQIRRQSSQQSRASHAVGGAGGVGASGADASRSATAAPWSGHRKLCTAAVGMLAGRCRTGLAVPVVCALWTQCTSIYVRHMTFSLLEHVLAAGTDDSGGGGGGPIR